MTTGEFKSLVESLEENSRGCKLWPFARNGKGYGSVLLNGKQVRAHRASYILFKSKIPEGFFACHKCDCPPCVNPDHLFAGSHHENMYDMAKKGRRGTGKKNIISVPFARPIGEVDFGPPIQDFDTPRPFSVHWNPIGGWMAVLEGINILNPYTRTLFKRRDDCIKIARFYGKHGFYPGLKKWDGHVLIPKVKKKQYA